MTAIHLDGGLGPLVTSALLTLSFSCCVLQPKPRAVPASRCSHYLHHQDLLLQSVVALHRGGGPGADQSLCRRRQYGPMDEELLDALHPQTTVHCDHVRRSQPELKERKRASILAGGVV